MSGHDWVVILAAGAGRRLAGSTGGVPKQFWRVGEGRSLLDDTIDRFALAMDPQAVVTVTPSDHGVGDVAVFRRGVRQAAGHVRARGDIVLLGVEPTEARDDYGWISIVIVTGSTRPGRRNEAVSPGGYGLASERTDAETSLVDMADYMPPLSEDFEQLTTFRPTRRWHPDTLSGPA